MEYLKNEKQELKALQNIVAIFKINSVDLFFWF